MRNQTKNSQSSGCLGNAIIYFAGAIVLGISFLSLQFLAPITEKAVQENFCKSGTIRNDKWGRRRDTTCIDKKTGKKIDVSIWQITGCCPVALIFFGGMIFVVILRLIINAVEKPGENIRR